MAQNTSPIFPLTPRSTGLSVVGAGAITARTAIVGTTGLSLCLAAGANGTRIDSIKMTGTGTTLAGLIDFWIYDGTTSRLYTSQLVAVVVASTTVQQWEAKLSFMDLVLPTGYSLYCSSQVATQLVGVVTAAGDY